MSGEQKATSTVVQPEVTTEQQTRRLPPYNVVILNDEEHTFPYVIELLTKLFRHPLPKAEELTCAFTPRAARSSIRLTRSSPSSNATRSLLMGQTTGSKRPRARSAATSSPRRPIDRARKSRSTAMPAQGANSVGRFSVELEVANYGDLALMQRGLLPPDQVRRETIQGVPDSDATKLVLPESLVKRLGLPLGGKVKVKYADGRRAQRQEAKGVFVKLLGRDGTFTAISEPKRETALIRRNRPRGPRFARRLLDATGRSP